ncbi:MAG TPA: hypothetical protein VK636_02475, partial [Gemmatimonadaceae bacterium]|nr:hypothetical protein [Gemmatimonadaceae bacterium]
MKTSRVLDIIRSASLAGLLACGAASDSTGPGGNNGNACTGTYYLSATIDGTAWCSSAGTETTGVPLTLAGLYSVT